MRRAAWWVGGLAGLAMVVSIGTPLLGLRVFHASDVLQLFAPWHDESPVETKPVNSQVTDTVDAGIPVRAEFRRRLLDGDFPLWDPYTNGGSPLGAVPNSGSLSPLSLPYVLLPTWYAPAFAKLLEMIVALGFTFLFLRRVGLGRPAALLGGMVFAFSAFQVVWTNWPQPQVGALIPALFWSTERVLQLRTIRSAIPVALVTASLLLGGFPAVVGYALIGLGVYVVARLAAMRGERPSARGRPVVLALSAVVLGAGITAVQLVPFYHQINRNELGERTSLKGKHLPLRSLLTLAVPDAFGSPVDHVYYLPWNYVEAESFIGATALLLVGASALGTRTSRRSPNEAGQERTDDVPRLVPGATIGLWALTALAVVVIYVGGPPLQLLERLPLLGANFIGRVRSVMGFGLAALAAFGFERLARMGPAWVRARLRGWPGLVAILATAAAAYALWRGWRFAAHVGREGYVLRQAAIPAVAVGIAILVLLAGGRRGRRSVAVWIIPALVAAECAAFAIPFWPRIPRDQFYPTTAVHRFLADRLGHDRFVAENRTMYAGTSSFYGIRSVTGHAFQEQTWADLLVAADPTVYRASRRVPFFAADPRVAASPILDQLGARYFVASPEVPVFGTREEIRAGEGSVTMAAGRSVSATLAGGPIRAVIVEIRGSPERLSNDARLRAELTDETGRVFAAGERRVFPNRKPGDFAIAVVGAEAPRSTRPVDLRLSLAASGGTLTLSAGSGGRVSVSTVKPADDGLRVALSGPAVVYERTRAFPRIRWASKATVVLSSRERVAALRRGIGARQVLLSSDGPPGLGLPARIEVLEDSGDEVRVRVDAEGDGYVVVADPIQYGWDARLDGSHESLRAADHAGVAVHVPAGTHEVTFSYRPPGRRVGLGLTAISLFVLGGVTVATSRRRVPVPPEDEAA